MNVNNDELKLMELMIQMGFEKELIMETIYHFGFNKPIGIAYIDALISRKEAMNPGVSNEQ